MKEWGQLRGQIRRDPLYRRVLDTVRRHAMLEEGTKVLAGLSGGADSVCMTVLLAAMREDIAFDLSALHVEHGLRESAEEDLLFSEKLCLQTGIPFEAVRVDVCALMERERIGAEEAARILRHEAFDHYSMRNPSCRIALAHHREDQAETVLFHLVRGSSLRGLRGMRPCAQNRIRPLFFESREEIENFLVRCGIGWRTDETNSDPQYARNRIRLQIMPLLEQVNTQAQAHLARAGEEAAEVEAFLEELTGEAIGSCVREGTKIEIEALLAQKRLLQKRVLYETLAAFTGGCKDLQDSHIESLLSLCMSHGEKSIALPGGVRAVKSYGVLRFEKEGDSSFDPAHWPLSADGYTTEIFSYDRKRDSIPQNPYTKWFDYDKISSLPFSGPVFRNRRKGDRLAVDDAGTEKLLSRYMIDEKIPRSVRDLLVLPFAGDDVLWIPGFRMNAAYKVRENTERVLRISWNPRENEQ